MAVNFEAFENSVFGTSKPIRYSIYYIAFQPSRMLLMLGTSSFVETEYVIGSDLGLRRSDWT